jgi:hypothetical protein
MEGILVVGVEDEVEAGVGVGFIAVDVVGSGHGGKTVVRKVLDWSKQLGFKP